MVGECLSDLAERDVEVGRVADQALEEQVGAAAAAASPGTNRASSAEAQKAPQCHTGRGFFYGLGCNKWCRLTPAFHWCHLIEAELQSFSSGFILVFTY